MTPELIKQWAKEAGLREDSAGWHSEWSLHSVEHEDLAAFAALVAAHQRELDARVCDEAIGKLRDQRLIGAEIREAAEATCRFCAAAIRGTK